MSRGFSFELNTTEIPIGSFVKVSIYGASKKSLVQLELIDCTLNEKKCLATAHTDEWGDCEYQFKVYAEALLIPDHEFALRAVVGNQRKEHTVRIVAEGLRLIIPRQLAWGQAFTLRVENGKPNEPVEFGIKKDGYVYTFPGPFITDDKGEGSWEVTMPNKPS